MFYYMWVFGSQVILILRPSCDQDSANKRLFPLFREATHSLALIGQAGLGEKMFEIVDGRRWTDAVPWLYYKLTR